MASAGPVNSVERHDLLGSIYAEMGDVQKASDELQEAIRLAPADDQRYFRLGMLYLKYRTPSLGGACVRQWCRAETGFADVVAGTRCESMSG